MFPHASGDLVLDEEQADRLHSAVADLTPVQLQWVSGYAAGLAAASVVESAQDAVPSPAAERGKRLTVLFGSQTGNGEALAEALASQARDRGFASETISLAEFRPADLRRESLLCIVVSTHGDGDPPDDAELFHEYLMSAKAPALSGLHYSLLALGDSSYVNFCQTGRELDARLSELGAKRFAATVECDLDYDEAATTWTDGVVASLPGQLEGTPRVARLRAVETAASFDRQHPYAAEVLVNQKITGAASTKDVRHIELSLEGSGLRYEAGDSLAVIPENPPALVDEFLAIPGFDADEIVAVRGSRMTLREALSTRLEITAASVAFIRQWSKLSGSEDLQRLLESDNGEALAAFLDSHQVIDVVRFFPFVVPAQAFVDALRNLSPRLYSISSGPAANPGEVHLTVAPVRYDAFGTRHWGVASTHLADRVAEGDCVSVYVEANKRFRLPEPDRPIIMIGPGTGVAPFRAFVQERIEQGASGDSWLLFGDRNSDSDFLYQLEWQRHLKNGHLTRMDVAFSRDQAEKIYVQQRIAEHAEELYRWIEKGAAIYVCGDARRMAQDVHDALISVLVTHAQLDDDAAEQRLRELRRVGRYQRDVY